MDIGILSSILVLVVVLWWSWVIHCAHKVDILKFEAEIANAETRFLEQQLAETRSELEELKLLKNRLESENALSTSRIADEDKSKELTSRYSQRP